MTRAQDVPLQVELRGEIVLSLLSRMFYWTSALVLVLILGPYSPWSLFPPGDVGGTVFILYHKPMLPSAAHLIHVQYLLRVGILLLASDKHKTPLKASRRPPLHAFSKSDISFWEAQSSARGRRFEELVQRARILLASTY